MLTYKNLLKIRGIKDNTKDAKNLYILYKFCAQRAKYDNGKLLNSLKYINININFNYIYTYELKVNNKRIKFGWRASKNYPKHILMPPYNYKDFKIYKITAKNYKKYKLNYLSLFMTNYELTKLFNN